LCLTQSASDGYIYFHALAACTADIRECLFSHIVGFGRHQVLVNHRATMLRDLIARHFSRQDMPKSGKNASRAQNLIFNYSL